MKQKKIKGVSSFAVSSSIPGDELHWGRSFFRKDTPGSSVNCAIVAIDENFFNLFGARFSAGNNYPDGTTAWQNAIIINETAAKAFGYADASQAVGQTIMWNENDQPLPKRVIGVVKDYNQQSLRKNVEPIVFTLKKYVIAPWAGEFYAFKINGDDLKKSIADPMHYGLVYIHKIRLIISLWMIISTRSIRMMNNSARCLHYFPD